MTDTSAIYRENPIRFPFPVSFTTENNQFRSLSINGSYRLLSLICDGKEIHRISHECAYVCGKWSPTRPNIVFALTSDGYLHVYDLLQNDEQPIEVKAITSTRLISMDVQAFHTKQYLTMASQDGSSYILRIPRELCKSYSSDVTDFGLYLERLKGSKVEFTTTQPAPTKIQVKCPSPSIFMNK